MKRDKLPTSLRDEEITQLVDANARLRAANSALVLDRAALVDVLATLLRAPGVLPHRVLIEKALRIHSGS
jgi:hypothetical protein